MTKRHPNRTSRDSPGQDPGWPKTFNVVANYRRKAVAYPPTIRARGISHAAV